MRIIFGEIMQVRIYVSDEILLSVLSPIAHLQTACMAIVNGEKIQTSTIWQSLIVGL